MKIGLVFPQLLRVIHQSGSLTFILTVYPKELWNSSPHSKTHQGNFLLYFLVFWLVWSLASYRRSPRAPFHDYASSILDFSLVSNSKFLDLRLLGKMDYPFGEAAHPTSFLGRDAWEISFLSTYMSEYSLIIASIPISIWI